MTPPNQKLLHICRNFATTRVFTRMFAHLARAGYEQRVYVPELSAANVGCNLPEGELFPVQYSRILRRWDALLYHTKARRAVPDVARLYDLDGDGRREIGLIHAHTLFTDGGIAYGLHKRYGIPFVVSVRFTDLEYFFRFMPHLHGHAMKMLCAASRVLFLSPASRRRMFDRYVPKKMRDALWAKSEIVPNGIEDEWFLDASPRSWQPGEPLRVAFAGHLEKRKQPLRAADAIAVLQDLLPESPVTLRVAGSGPLEKELRAHPAQERISLVGRLESPEAMRAFYDECHLFLLPSLAETFGMVYLEAMSRGLPVLYTRGQGFEGQFEEGEAGFAVNPADAEAIAEAAMAALDGYASRSSRCIALASTLCWGNVVERMAAVYSACGLHAGRAGKEPL